MNTFCLMSLLFACIALSTAAQCPIYKTVENFDVNRYLGRWYEIKRLPLIFEAFQSCITADYSLIDEKTIRVNNTGVYRLSKIAIPYSVIGTAVSSDVPSSLTVRFPQSKNVDEPNYNILATDYDSYALVYTCRVEKSWFGLGKEKKTEYAWLLSRQRTMDESLIRRLESSLKGLGVDTGKLYQNNQEDC